MTTERIDEFGVECWMRLTHVSFGNRGYYEGEIVDPADPNSGLSAAMIYQSITTLENNMPIAFDMSRWLVYNDKTYLWVLLGGRVYQDMVLPDEYAEAITVCAGGKCSAYMPRIDPKLDAFMKSLGGTDSLPIRE